MTRTRDVFCYSDTHLPHRRSFVYGFTTDREGQVQFSANHRTECGFTQTPMKPACSLFLADTLARRYKVAFVIIQPHGSLQSAHRAL